MLKMILSHPSTFKIGKILLSFSSVVILGILMENKRRIFQKRKETFKNLGFIKILKKSALEKKYFLGDFKENETFSKIIQQKNRNNNYYNPTGIYNYGNNCYLNSLIQVKINF